MHKSLYNSMAEKCLFTSTGLRAQNSFNNESAFHRQNGMQTINELWTWLSMVVYFSPTCCIWIIQLIIFFFYLTFNVLLLNNILDIVFLKYICTVSSLGKFKNNGNTLPVVWLLFQVSLYESISLQPIVTKELMVIYKNVLWPQYILLLIDLLYC